MAYEQRDNSGSLFRNDKKQTENQPDYRGTVMVNGVEYWISSWLKVGQSGVKFMSLAFTEKEPPKAQEGFDPNTGTGSDPMPGDDLNADIPF